MNATALFAQSLSADQLDLYRYIPTAAEELQSTMPCKIFRLLLRLRHGKHSPTYLMTGYSWWGHALAHKDEWDELDDGSKRAAIESSARYFLHLANYHGFNLIARVWRDPRFFLPVRVKQEIDRVLSGQRPSARRSTAARTHIAIVLLGASQEKLMAAEHIAKWLDLIIGNLDVALYVPEEVSIGSAAGNNYTRYHPVLKPQMSSLRSMSKAGTLFFSPEEEGKKGKIRIHLESLLGTAGYKCVLISADDDSLDQKLWTARFARALNSSGGSDRSEQPMLEFPGLASVSAQAFEDKPVCDAAVGANRHQQGLRFRSAVLVHLGWVSFGMLSSRRPALARSFSLYLAATC